MVIWEWAQKWIIYLSHVNAHQKVTTMESILNDKVYKIT